MLKFNLRIAAAMLALLLMVASIGGLQAQEVDQDSFKESPQILSMSALSFGPENTLFIGDSKGGSIFAIQIATGSPSEAKEGINIAGIETQIAAMLGTTAEQIMIHDLAVHRPSQEIYLAVSRGRGSWDNRWYLPNDLADANILLKIDSAGEISEVSLEGLEISAVSLPNPVEVGKDHRWKKGISLRADTITDMAYSKGTLYVAGLSNEEFASTMWRVPYPFQGGPTATTLEIFHGAHGKYETNAPIRAFVPYALENEEHLLAAYLCTPLVTFPTADLDDGEHVKGRTVAEFGSGNYPLDMIVYQKNGKDRLLIANSNLPLMIVDPQDVEDFEGSITEEVEGYVAGVSYEIRSGTGVQQLDNLNADHVVALQRLPGGTLDLVSLPTQRF